VKVQGSEFPLAASVATGVFPSQPVVGDKGRQLNLPQDAKSPPSEVKDEQQQEKVSKAVEQLNAALDTFHIELRFVIDHNSGEMVVYMVNTAKGEIVRRIPPDHVINAAGRLQEMLGLFINKLI
jgi:flagellar protein FlaG